jgi:hypothetical protein
MSTLYTDQGYDLNAFPGPIRPELSPYASDPDVGPALRRLHSILANDQFIWCAQSQSIASIDPGSYRHEIEFVENDQVAIIDFYHWARIIRYAADYIPREEERQLKARAAQSDDDYLGEYRRLCREYVTLNSVEDPWAAVIKRKIEKGSDQVLLRFPFKASVVCKVTTH